MEPMENEEEAEEEKEETEQNDDTNEAESSKAKKARKKAKKAKKKELGVFCVEVFIQRQEQLDYVERISNAYPSSIDVGSTSLLALANCKEKMRKLGILKARDLHNLRGQTRGEQVNCPCHANTVVWQHPVTKVIVITCTEDDHQRYGSWGWEKMSHFYCHMTGDKDTFDGMVAGAVEVAPARADGSATSSSPAGGAPSTQGRNSPKLDRLSRFCHEKGKTEEFLARFVDGTLPVLQWNSTVVPSNNSTFRNILSDYIYFCSDDCIVEKSAKERRALVSSVTDKGTIIVRAAAAAARAAASAAARLPAHVDL